MKVVRSLALSIFVAVTVICGISVLISCSLDFPPIFLARGYWYEVHGLNSFEERQLLLSHTWPHNTLQEASRNFLDWKERSAEWWRNNLINPQDPNWEGRHRLHDSLKNGTLWYDEDLENAFLSRLEAHQFPERCTDNHWIAHRTHDSGLLSCAHIITPVLMMGILKGDGYTVVPISRPPGKTGLPTFDGCGEGKDKHIGCFFNLTSCRVEDDPYRAEVMNNQSARGVKGATWDSLWHDNTTQPGGMTILRSFMFRYDAQSHNDAWRRPKLRLWNQLKKEGRAGVHNRSDRAIDKLRDSQVDFALHGMMSAWMMRQTSDRVKKIANKIMSRYQDEMERPLWMPPVLALHVRQTDKKWEDPYFQQHKKYRSVDDYFEQMKSMEEQFNFRWESIFIISDSGSAIQSLAQALNNVTGLPDSLNGQEGKRFIMYDWTYDNALIERLGGHTKIPSDMKHSAQEHFLATLYIIHKIADYAIVQYSSNVGRFLSEIIGGKHRLASPDPVGPNAFSVDVFWVHNR
ncbi:hypothetical protein Mapa_014897 [Marchantia paleacea]|nr:hypothetical protein Mapa_014897 [Marchantia paleacea]